LKNNARSELNNAEPLVRSDEAALSIRTSITMANCRKFFKELELPRADVI